jgi:hypothetical protein
LLAFLFACAQLIPILLLLLLHFIFCRWWWPERAGLRFRLEYRSIFL